MKKKISATKSTQTINNDNKEIIPGYTKQMLEDIGIKIVTYRKQYYIDNRELTNEPVMTAIDRFIDSI